MLLIRLANQQWPLGPAGRPLQIDQSGHATQVTGGLWFPIWEQQPSMVAAEVVRLVLSSDAITPDHECGATLRLSRWRMAGSGVAVMSSGFDRVRSG